MPGEVVRVADLQTPKKRYGDSRNGTNSIGCRAKSVDLIPLPWALWFAWWEVWLQRTDLNRRPLGYEPNELPDRSTLRSSNTKPPGNRNEKLVEFRVQVGKQRFYGVELAAVS